MEIDYTELIEGFIEELKKYGLNLEVLDFHYRGFGSQGDGLSFDFKLNSIHNCNKFLKSIEIENDLHLYEISDIVIFTFKNSFSTHYCHEKTRNIVVVITTEDDVSGLVENLEEEIERWYYSKCQEFYKILEEHHNEVEVLNEEDEEEIEFEREEWDDDTDGYDDGDIESIIIDRIDPDMNVRKIINMIEDSYALSNTNSEQDELIKKFIENFEKEYIIIKRIN